MLGSSEEIRDVKAGSTSRTIEVSVHDVTRRSSLADDWSVFDRDDRWAA